MSGLVAAARELTVDMGLRVPIVADVDFANAQPKRSAEQPS